MQLISKQNRQQCEYIGRCLKDARRALNLSRITIAKAMGTNKNHWLKYEYGGQKLPDDYLVDLLCAGMRALTTSVGSK